MRKVLLIGAALAAVSVGMMTPAAAQPGYGGYGYSDDRGYDGRDGWRGGDRRWDDHDRWAERARWEERRRWMEHRRWEEERYRWDNRGYGSGATFSFGF